MIPSINCYLLLFVAVTISFPAFGQSIPNSTPKQRTIVFRPAHELLPAGRVKLVNGTEVSREDWPTLVLADIYVPGTDKPGTCTGTLVGPNTILVAAHCVDSPDDTPLPNVQLWIDSRRIELSCERHPDYLKQDYRPSAPRGSEDFALCLIKDGGRRPAFLKKINYEVVEPEISLNPGDKVLMTGYGCSVLNLTSDGKLNAVPERGILRIGDEKIDAAFETWKSAYVTIRSQRGREPALCPGDSGGPLLTGATLTNPDRVRRVRGVNSSICTVQRNTNSRCATMTGPGTWDIISSIAATGTPSFKPWADDWILRNQSSIPIVCGINRAAGEMPCRQ